MSMIDPGKVMEISVLEERMAIEGIHPHVEADKSEQRDDRHLDTIEGDEIEQLADQAGRWCSRS